MMSDFHSGMSFVLLAVNNHHCMQTETQIMIQIQLVEFQKHTSCT